jgi:hypothetical protein
MDSSGDDEPQEFANKGGEAMNMDGHEGFNDSEDVDDIDDDAEKDVAKKETSA